MKVTVFNSFIATTLLSSLALAADYNFSTYERPFRAVSLWNSQPINPVLGTYVIPDTSTGWYPAVTSGAYSSSIYLAKSTDKALTVNAFDTDLMATKDIYIPRFPRDVVPATGDDGHADIVDPYTNIIHSFYKLKKNSDGSYTAKTYNYTWLTGDGFGSPAHFQAGARAAGVVTMAGMIRKHEVDDGLDHYRHALAISLDLSAMKKSPDGKRTFIFPVTGEDNGSTTATGYAAVNGHEMGARLMLPANFDLSKIKKPRLRKVAKTLMMYGAMVVDTNYKTPFVIYVENGFSYTNSPGVTGWDNAAASDLKLIQRSLRKMVSNSGYVGGDGVKFSPNKKLNILSLRGGWYANGKIVGEFKPLQQSVMIPAAVNGKPLELIQTWTNNVFGANFCSYACKKPGKLYRFSVQTTSNSKMQLIIKSAKGVVTFKSKLLGKGQYQIFTMPSDSSIINEYAVGDQGVSYVNASLREE